MLSHGRPVRFRPPGALARLWWGLVRGLREAIPSPGPGCHPREEQLLPLIDPALIREFQVAAASPKGFTLPQPDPELDNPINKDGVPRRSVLPPSNPKYRSEYSVEGYPRPQPTRVPGPGRRRSL